MKQVNVKKLILPNIPYVFIALLATKVSEAVRLAPGSDASAKLLNIMTGLNTAFHSLVPSFHPIDLCVGVTAAIAIRLAVYIKGKNAKKFRKNLEYGSARWGTAEDIKPYVDPAFENNIILTQTERLTMNSRPKDPKTARNKNVLIVGGSGSGKTRFWLKPNLLQCTSKTYPTSFVVTDPKGDIVVSCGHVLQKNGYPYIWGGSSPSTSFDCSGFVSWVINHSGWDVGRLGAQGLCNICTPVSSANVKPGDLVFFTGTYDTPGVSHVGIYVGNNMMIHCGDPISYANLNSNYWQSHFYRYGRLP